VDGLGDLRGVAVDSDGAVHVAGRQAGTGLKIAPDRSRSVVASGLDRPSGLALDPAGRLVIAEEGANRVIRLEDDGPRTTLIANIPGPSWLVVRPDGTLYVSARPLASDATRPDGESADSKAVWRPSDPACPGRPLSGMAILFRKHHDREYLLMTYVTSESANDHYAYSEALFQVSSSGPALVKQIHFFLDIAGMEGLEWPLLWPVNIIVLLPFWALISIDRLRHGIGRLLYRTPQ
jgi:hypothetical protein